MRKLALVLVVAGLLALAQAGQAADLQAGWYVKLGDVGLFGVDPVGQHAVAVEWSFAGGLGTFGPFAVTSPSESYPQRQVSVPDSAYDIPSGIHVDLTGAPASTNFIANSLQFVYDTSYDVACMRFDLYVSHANGTFEKLYSETRSGQHGLAPTVALHGRYDPVSDSLIFRTTVVPEPASVLALALAIACGFGTQKRRTR